MTNQLKIRQTNYTAASLEITNIKIKDYKRGKRYMTLPMWGCQGEKRKHQAS